MAPQTRQAYQGITSGATSSVNTPPTRPDSKGSHKQYAHFNKSKELKRALQTLTPDQWGTRIKPTDVNGNTSSNSINQSGRGSSHAATSRENKPPSRRFSQAHRENDIHDMDYPSTERQEYSSANPNKFTLGKESEEQEENLLNF
eukprot:CAMPEP_0114590022 /NCGR_PEP_ID=MMETSP0125-20121206/12345_1 /TAXON_ID=485358 ORGANISM="Aristerostoma sp., Strain ATCC 50986" /NCGR_SAMPLE_ID=MMETSP0125 /ASSEMBLY_ACC=CAM_ASM_000245 /LENGTH=144 /DNA_ID=CAMNT_0001787243 /DNA_START=303 /DNA_END=737 /DNA_ORIENTATION=+